jgi:hypothetical protein
LVTSLEQVTLSRYWVIWIDYYGAMGLGPAGFMLLKTRAVEKFCWSTCLWVSRPGITRDIVSSWS